MLSVNWFWKKCRLARFSERIPLWQSPPRRDGCLVFVTFPTNLHVCDKNQVWVNGSMGLGCFGKRERLEEEREREGLLLMSSHERLSPPRPYFLKIPHFAPPVLNAWVLCSHCFEVWVLCFPCFKSMRHYSPLYWKYKSFVPLVLKVLVLCSPRFESISPFFTFLWFNVLKVWAFCFLFWYQSFKKFHPWFTLPSSTFYPGLPILSLISLEMTIRRYDVILIKIRRHDRSHLRVDTWEEESRKVEKFNVSLFQISINLSSFVCLPVFFSCSWSSRLNLVVIVQCLVREHFSTNWTFQKLTNEEYRWEPRCEFDSITKKFLHLKPRSRGRRRLKEWKRKTSCEGLLIRRRRQELLFPASLPAALLLSQCCLKEW